MRVARFLLLLVLVGLGFGVFTLFSFNACDQIEHSFAGECTPVTGVVGAEDIRFNYSTGLAFISSVDRRDAAARGAVHLFDPSNPPGGAGWRDITNGAPEAFRPLGLDYYQDDQVRRLFVVNEAKRSVEIFDVNEDGSLSHLSQITDRELTSPNNVLAVGPESFYVTNDLKPGRNTAIGKLHFLAKTPSGQVFYHNGEKLAPAADGLRFANGISKSTDGSVIYVSETSGRSIQVYSRDSQTGRLTPKRVIQLDIAPNNITVDSEGSLWLGGLPKPLSVPRHEEDPSQIAASGVVRIRQGGEPEMIYQDPGDELSASTAAARMRNKLLIGALYEQKFLICELPETLF